MHHVSHHVLHPPAAEPSEPSEQMLISQPDKDVHSLLVGLLRPASSPTSEQQLDSPTGSLTSMKHAELSLHQQVLQQAQDQHHAVQWLIQICADTALGDTVVREAPLQPASSCADSSNATVGGWVLLGELLGILDDYTHSLSFRYEDIQPGAGQHGSPDMVLLNLTIVAEAVGQAQRWVQTAPVKCLLDLLLCTSLVELLRVYCIAWLHGGNTRLKRVYYLTTWVYLPATLVVKALCHADILITRCNQQTRDQNPNFWGLGMHWVMPAQQSMKLWHASRPTGHTQPPSTMKPMRAGEKYAADLHIHNKLLS